MVQAGRRLHASAQVAPEWQRWAEGDSAPYGPFGPPMEAYGARAEPPFGGVGADPPLGGVSPEGHRAPPSLAAAVQAMSAIQVLPLRSRSVGRL